MAKRLSWKLLCTTKTDNTAIRLPLILHLADERVSKYCSSLFRAYLYELIIHNTAILV